MRKTQLKLNAESNGFKYLGECDTAVGAKEAVDRSICSSRSRGPAGKVRRLDRSDRSEPSLEGDDSRSGDQYCVATGYVRQPHSRFPGRANLYLISATRCRCARRV